MENDDGDTILNTTFNAGSSQHHPQMPIHTSPLRYQSMPPQTGTIRMQETPVPAMPAAPQKPIMPRIPLPTSSNSGSHLSQLSAPLFTEDRCSSTSEEELEVDAEVTLINRKNKPTGCSRITQQLGDQRPHQQLWITQPRVIQTK